MERFQSEQDMLDQEQENSNGDYEKVKAIFEKKIQLYNRYLTEDDLSDMDRLRLENKKEWIMSHILSLIINDDTTNKISELTEHVYRLEKKTAELEENYE